MYSGRTVRPFLVKCRAGAFARLFFIHKGDRDRVFSKSYRGSGDFGFQLAMVVLPKRLAEDQMRSALL